MVSAVISRDASGADSPFFFFMSTSIKDPEELKRIYERRFERMLDYRNRVWTVLVEDFFQRYVQPGDCVLDLGCGYGEFINRVRCARKYGMDLNPQTSRHLATDVEFLSQDCSTPWQLPDSSLDVVFTSNFFEHLPDKLALRSTLREAARCLRPGGHLVAMGPNIKYLPGLYWDFFDHHTILTEASLGEVLEMEGFLLERVTPRFLPYTLVNAPEYSLLLLRIYLAMPWLWWIKGRQFLVVAVKPN